MKVHDLALRADYEIASKEHEYFFELDVSFAYTPCLFIMCTLHIYTKCIFIALMDNEALK